MCAWPCVTFQRLGFLISIRIGIHWDQKFIRIEILFIRIENFWNLRIQIPNFSPEQSVSGFKHFHLVQVGLPPVPCNARSRKKETSSKIQYSWTLILMKMDWFVKCHQYSSLLLVWQFLLLVVNKVIYYRIKVVASHYKCRHHTIGYKTVQKPPFYFRNHYQRSPCTSVSKIIDQLSA